MTRARALAAALAVLATAGAALGLAGRLRAEEPALPADVVPSTGIPPFLPAAEARASPEAVKAWAERVAEAAGRAGAARRAGELLYSAASALPTSTGPEAFAARKLYLQAQQTAPQADPISALANLQVLRLSCALGQFEYAKLAGAWLERWEREDAPVDADPVTAQRVAMVRTEMATQFQIDAATLFEGLGDFRGAAQRLERLAEANPPGLKVRLPVILERAAVDRFRAGETAQAQADVAKALAAEPTPEERARLLFWVLHVKHGLLSVEGALRPTGVWPGAAYQADLHETLRDLSGNPHVGPYLLSAASSALLARADDDALALYLLALRDPALRERSWSDPGVVGGLLSAVPVAIRLERFDAAEDLLDELERRSGRPVPDAAPLRARVKLAREAAAEREAAREAPPPQPPGSTPPRATPEMLPPARDAEPERTTRTDAAPDARGGWPWWLWGGAALGAVLLLRLALRTRR